MSVNFQGTFTATGDSRREPLIFGMLLVSGIILYFLRVKIPHTEVFIDGRMVVVFCGAALLQRWRFLIILALVLSFPFISEVDFLIALFGNLGYVVPCILVARLLHSRFLNSLKNPPAYALAWFFTVLVCYQLFNTPIVWGLLAIIQEQSVAQYVLRGWRSQPFFVESLLVAMSTSMVMLGILSYYREEQSRKELLITLNSISEGVIATDGGGRVVRMNPFAQKLTGWSEDAAKNRSLDEVFRIVSGATHEPIASPVKEVLRTGRVVTLANDTLLIARDGEKHQIADGAAPIRDEHGGLHGVVLVFRDVTSEYNTIRELRDAEYKHRVVLDHAEEAIFVVEDGVICFANDKTAEILGVRNPASQQLHFSMVVHQEDQDIVLPLFQQEEERQKATCSFRITTADGESKWVELTVVPIIWGERPALLSFLRDNTDIKKMEQQLQQAQRMEAIGNLAGGVAHDYNNISSVIIGYTELVMERFNPNEPVYAELEEVRAAANRSAEITRQLLAFARQQTVEPRVLDLNKTLEQMLKMLHRLIGEDITLSWQPGPQLWSVRIDPTQVDQILANLCINARDAIEGVGTLSIETENVTFNQEYCGDHVGFVPGDFVMLSVSDSGCGMSDDMLAKVFEPFYTTKGPGKGTGLGLATVYGIMKQNNGFVNIYSELGRGTTFRLYFPRHYEDLVDSFETADTKDPAGGEETLLLVEDDLAILNIAKIILEGLGYTVLTGHTPREGELVAREYRDGIDLLITDVVMPEMNGRELSTVIKQYYPTIKTLYMSGYTADVINHSGVLDEGICFLQKPFSKRDLAAKVREALCAEINQ